jgi:hypothetical protein
MPLNINNVTLLIEQKTIAAVVAFYKKLLFWLKFEV